MKTDTQKKSRKNSAENEILRQQLARTLADYDNLKKRIEAEKSEFTKWANLRLIMKFLSVFDMLLGAQAHLQDSGLEIIIGQFREVFKSEEIIELGVEKGDFFDENIHEAVETITASKKEDNNKIAEIVAGGFKYADGPIIRHAKVKVFKFN